MTKIEKIVLGIATLALAVAVGVAIYAVGGSEDEKVGLIRPSASGEGKYTNYDNIQLDNGLLDARAGTTTMTSYGTTTGPQYVSYGAFDRAVVPEPIIATTSVLCSLPNPFGNSTSSIDGINVGITTGLTGDNALVYSISTSSTAIGSSTRAIVYNHTVAGGAQDYLAWKPQVFVGSTTASGITNAELAKRFSYTDGSAGLSDGRSPFILGPNEFINVRISTTTLGLAHASGGTGNSVRGSCSLEASKPN